MQLKRILSLNLLGLILLVSWGWPQLMLWTQLDDSVFWFFNNLISQEDNLWERTLALLNTRFFDAFSFGVMALLFYFAIRLDPRQQRAYRWLGIGLVMLLTAGVLALLTLKGIHYGHPSPTRVFDHARRLTDIVTIPTKDSASNSFPGDHGLMLMVFAAFMLRFADRRVAWASVAFVVLLSAPRIMVGAHWFSDIYIGSLTIALLALPWVLLTPLGPGLARGFGDGLIRLAGRLRD